MSFVHGSPTAICSSSLTQHLKSTPVRALFLLLMLIIAPSDRRDLCLSSLAYLKVNCRLAMIQMMKVTSTVISKTREDGHCIFTIPSWSTARPWTCTLKPSMKLGKRKVMEFPKTGKTRRYHQSQLSKSLKLFHQP